MASISGHVKAQPDIARDGSGVAFEGMTGADLKPARKARLGAIALVTILHLAAIAVLVRAFTPELAASITGRVTQAFDIPLDPPRPPPEPRREPTPAAKPMAPATEGGAGSPGKRAAPRAVAVPRTVIAIRPTQAPQVVGKGTENASGARDQGDGTGASGQGTGTGAGTGGSGRGGGGAASGPVKIGGDINSARDYPRRSRDLRLGSEVIVSLKVGVDGRVKGCRVIRASLDDEADRITCLLAAERFRFRPARDAAGKPVEAEFGWRQRWFLRDAG